MKVDMHSPFIKGRLKIDSVKSQKYFYGLN